MVEFDISLAYWMAKDGSPLATLMVDRQCKPRRSIVRSFVRWASIHGASSSVLGSGLSSLDGCGALADCLLISGGPTDDELGDAALGILQKFKAGRSGRRHEMRLRLSNQRELGFVEPLYKQHVAGYGHYGFASGRDFIYASVGL